MSSIIQELLTPQLMAAFGLIVACLAVLYILQIVYVNVDAGRRGANRILWTIIGIVPIVGLIAYLVLRPTFYIQDLHEQETQGALIERQLSDYGICPKCGKPVKSSYVCCPHCGTRINNVCPNCGRPVSPEFDYCPYCTTKINKGTTYDHAA